MSRRSYGSARAAGQARRRQSSAHRGGREWRSRGGAGADAAQELVRLEHAYAQALMRKDRGFLMRFYASDWRGGNWMGFWTKSTMLKAVLSDRYVVKS
jgi:hypothetical protein